MTGKGLETMRLILKVWHREKAEVTAVRPFAKT